MTALAELVGNLQALTRLLASPIDRQTARMPYLDIGEGDLVSDEHLRGTMPFLFD